MSENEKVWVPSDADGSLVRVEHGAVVVAAGTLNTPQPCRCGCSRQLPSSRLVGRDLRLHPVSSVFGLFDEPQDAHMVYPITGPLDGAVGVTRGGRVRDRGDDDDGPDRLRDHTEDE